MTRSEVVLIWWCFWMLVEASKLHSRWPRYRKMYNITTSRWLIAILVAGYLLIAPAKRIWELFKPLFVLQHYKVQIEIFRYDGRNAKVQSDINSISDGEEIAVKLIEGDSTISAIYYQVITMHEDAVIEARAKR